MLANAQSVMQHTHTLVPAFGICVVGRITNLRVPSACSQLDALKLVQTSAATPFNAASFFDPLLLLPLTTLPVFAQDLLQVGAHTAAKVLL